jgi:hypothetical protein
MPGSKADHGAELPFPDLKRMKMPLSNKLLYHLQPALGYDREANRRRLGVVAEDGLIHLEERLNGDALGLHIGHFALNGLRPHDGGCEDHCKIEWGHLRLLLVGEK